MELLACEQALCLGKKLARIPRSTKGLFTGYGTVKKLCLYRSLLLPSEQSAKDSICIERKQDLTEESSHQRKLVYWEQQEL